jgi:hypothetical protein
MPTSPTYLLDANVYVQAYQKYYAFDIAPKFWQALERLAHERRVISIDRIRSELEAQTDPLSTWACTACGHAFESTNDQAVFAAYAEMVNWVQSRDFTPAAKSEFSSVADGWLAATAKARGYTVVTHEISEPNRKSRVKIPDLCKQFDVECVNGFEMLRAVGAKLW